MPKAEQQVRIANKERSHYIFPIHGDPTANDPNGKILGFLHIGDIADGYGKPPQPGEPPSCWDLTPRLDPSIPRSWRCPDPVAVLSLQEWDELGAGNRAAIRALVDSGELDLTGDPGEAA